MEYGKYGHYIKTMALKTNSGMGLAKIAAGIPPVATVQASVNNPGLALPAFMIQGVRSDSHIPQALMNVYLSIANIDLSNFRI